MEKQLELKGLYHWAEDEIQHMMRNSDLVRGRLNWDGGTVFSPTGNEDEVWSLNWETNEIKQLV